MNVVTKTPRYLAISKNIKEKILSGELRPGDMLPKAQDMADEYRVSSGTARMALRTLTEERFITIQNGVGSFVSEPQRIIDVPKSGTLAVYTPMYAIQHWRSQIFLKSVLEMAKRIRESSPHTNIVFVTAYSDYALDALALHPSGYLMKPASAEKVRVELDNLRFPPQRQPECRIRAQCFGNFEIFADEKPMSFQYQKSKELMAYLVDRRGAACNTAELCAVLWEGKPDTAELHKYLRKLLSDLSHSLTAVGAEEVLIKRRNSFAVAAEKIDCDYYRLLNRDVSAINTYTGEYMTQYSWAEMTLGSLKND